MSGIPQNFWSIEATCCSQLQKCNAWALLLKHVPQVRVETGAGFRGDGHVNLNLHHLPHPAAPARPAAVPPRLCHPRLSHSAPRQTPPRLALETSVRGPDRRWPSSLRRVLLILPSSRVRRPGGLRVRAFLPHAQLALCGINTWEKVSCSSHHWSNVDRSSQSCILHQLEPVVYLNVHLDLV